MIDPRTGALLLEGGVALDGALEVGAFRRSPLGRVALRGVTNHPWESFVVREAVCRDGARVLLRLFFREGLLKSIHLRLWVDDAVAEPDVVPIHDAWLRTFLGELPRAFPWGSLESSYDARADSTNVVITYGALQP